MTNGSRHIETVSRVRELPASAQTSQKEILLTGVTAIVESIILATQRKPWFG